MEIKRVYNVDFNDVNSLLEEDIKEVYIDQYSAFNFTSLDTVQCNRINEEIKDENAFCYYIIEDNKVIGYSLFYVMKEIFQHTKTTAVCSSIFIKKEKRSYKLFKDFINFIEMDLEEENIDVISISVKRTHSKLMERLFYQEEEICFTKKINK